VVAKHVAQLDDETLECRLTNINSIETGKIRLEGKVKFVLSSFSLSVSQ
jgi:hypothetical protein